MNLFKNKVILITGGTGSFGNAAVKILTQNKYKFKKIIIFSRDENKQYEMRKKFKDKNLRFLLGDVRDEERLVLALKDVDYVLHAAAQKHVPIAEYNPFECIKTNIYGTQCVISAAIKTGVKKVIALSTDKACNPINLYGATKLCLEKLCINANLMSPGKTTFSVVRYGNVIDSRGSVIPFFRELIEKNAKELPLTDKNMTRFFIKIDQAVNFVIDSFAQMQGGEVYIPKMDSIHIEDLIKMISPKARIKIIGTRPGEKINEILCSKDEANSVYDFKKSYIIYPSFFNVNKKKGKKVKSDFIYSSDLKKYLNKKNVKKLINS